MKLYEEQRAKLKEKLEEYFGENMIFDYQWEILFADMEEIL